jgi:hypothetical protein
MPSSSTHLSMHFSFKVLVATIAKTCTCEVRKIKSGVNFLANILKSVPLGDVYQTLKSSIFLLLFLANLSS